MRRIVISLVLVTGLASCGGSKSATSTAHPVNSAASQHQLEQARAQDRATQSDLRNALTAEKTVYTDEQAYEATIATLQQVEPSLDWGGALGVHVTSTGQTVCLDEASKSGAVFSIADWEGPGAGTWYGKTKCPTDLTKVDSLGTSWDDTSTSGPSNSENSDAATQADLRNALTAEKTVYVDSEKYDATAANMRDVEPSLDWGGKLKVSVGDAVSAGDAAVVCISESSAAGTTSSIGDVALGPLAGTYYGTTTCPAEPTPKSLAAFGSGCTASKPGTTVACFSSW